MKAKILIWIIGLMILSSFVYADLNTNLKYVYTFDEANGNLIDQINGSVNGTATGDLTYQQIGINNYSINFAGTDDYFKGTSATSFDNWSSITISCWFNSNIGASQQIMGWSSGVSRMHLTTLVDGAMYYRIPIGGVEVGNFYGTTPSTNQWNHVALTYNGSDIFGYLNGVQNGSASGISGTVDMSANWTIGVSFDVTRDFDGEIDECYIWDRALSDAEILELNSTFYPFNIGTTINLSSPNPVELSQFNTSTININVSGSFTYSDANVSLYINGTLNQTRTSVGSGSNINISFNITLNDGDWNYFLEAKDNTTNENTSTNIFYIDTISPVINNSSLDGNDTYWTNELNLNINTTDINLYSLLINDSCNYSYYNSSITSPYEFNQQINIIGCGVGQQQTNVTVCDGHGASLNCISRTYLWYSRSRLNITAFTIGGDQISNFSVYKNGTLMGNTTNGYYHLDNLTFGDYNITIDGGGYELKSEIITVNLTYQEFNMSFYTTNSISFIFKDEETNNIINDKVISIELISDIFANNYSTSNGTLYLDLLSPIIYAIRYSAANYTERFYYFNLQNRTHTNLTLYLLSNSSATEVTATVYDEGNHFVEDAYIKVLRYDLTTNSYIIQEIMKTNFEGQTMLHLILNDEFYKFIIEYPSGTVKKETSPTYIYATNLNFQILLGEDIASNFYNSQDISYSLIFNNNTNNFRFTYSDANNIVSQGCLKIYKITSFKESLYNSTCVSSATSTILLHAENITGTTYRADAFVYFGSDEYYLMSEYHIFEETNIAGNMGVLMIAILTILFVFTAIWSKSVALILTPLPLFFGSILNIIDLSIGITLPITIVCVIIAIWVSKR